MSWTLVARFASVGEAEAARSALDAAGIETFIADENIVAVDWLMSNAVGAVKLMVHEERLEQATEILALIPPAADAEPAEERDEPVAIEEPACPECGSGNLAEIPRLRIFALVALAALGVGYAVGQADMALAAVAAIALILLMVPSHRCLECNHRWNAPAVARRNVVPPLPEGRDLLEPQCPRCGSTEIQRISYRKLKAIPLLFTFTIVLVAPIYFFLPKWQCEQCGLRS